MLLFKHTFFQNPCQVIKSHSSINLHNTEYSYIITEENSCFLVRSNSKWMFSLSFPWFNVGFRSHPKFLAIHAEEAAPKIVFPDGLKSPQLLVGYRLASAQMRRPRW